MAIWPFTTKEKEQVEQQTPAAAETGGKEATGTNSLDALIAASQKGSPAPTDKRVPATPNPIARPATQDTIEGKTTPKNLDERASSSQILPTKSDSAASKEVSQEPPVSIFGILTIEEQQRLDEEKKKSSSEKKMPRQRKKLGRTIEVKVRLTEDEKKLLDSRVLASGESQGEFIRHAILHEKIETRRVFAVDAQAMSALMKMGSELGKIGGLIKKTVAVNKEFAVFTQEQKSQYEALMRDLEQLKNKMQKVVQEIYGHTKT